MGTKFDVSLFQLHLYQCDILLLCSSKRNSPSRMLLSLSSPFKSVSPSIFHAIYHTITSLWLRCHTFYSFLCLSHSCGLHLNLSLLRWKFHHVLTFTISFTTHALMASTHVDSRRLAKFFFTRKNPTGLHCVCCCETRQKKTYSSYFNQSIELFQSYITK